MVFACQLVQVCHAFDREWDGHSNAITRLRSERDSSWKDRDDFKSKMKTASSELGDMRLIARDKENELSSEHDKTKKVQKEVSVLKGTVKSLTSQIV